MPLDILNKFTSNLKNALGQAINLSWKFKNPEVSSLHLFIGLLEQKGSLAAEILRKANLQSGDYKKYLINYKPGISAPFPQLSETATQIIEKAALLAFNHQHIYIGTEHLLLALLTQPDEYFQHILKENRVNKDNLIKQLNDVMKSTARFPDLASIFTDEEKNQEEPEMAKSNTPALSFFCTDLTDQKIQTKIDPVIGRKKEIDRLIHILSRRTKNNPVLVGEAGVGKTAIAEGLAKRILEKNVPEVLMDKKIFRLDMGLVIAGTMYRGEFENRFKQIIEELEKNPNIILFIDEIHTIIGAGGGGATNAMDAANILKPSLARGELRCIGATTLQEYQKYIESDAALERRFQPILIEEPSFLEAIEVIKGIKSNYEKYHRIKISDDAVYAAVQLSDRYIQEKFLPDKAIDLIDEAAAKMKIEKPLDPQYLAVANLEKRLREIAKQKLAMVRQEKFEDALKLKTKERETKIKLAKLQEQQGKQPIKYIGEVTKKDIAEIIGKITGVPVSDLVTEEKNQLLNLNSLLNKEVVGQEEATKSVADFIRRSRAGLTSPNRPTGSFIFLGPSGVGKTELAKVLARQLFGNEKALLRIDMSEFSEKFNISKLIGAPAGYVGYKEGAKLTDQVKRKPYSVVLFDEIEKAHPDVFNLLLQIMEDGHLTDATGKKINFKNTIIIMTSNIGLKEFEQQAKIGFSSEKESKNIKYEEIKEHVLKQLKKQFKPEFLNRLDKIIVFKPLNEQSLIKIVDLEIKKLEARLKEKGMKIKIAKPVLKFIAQESFSPEQGGRAVRKTVQELIENTLAEKILSNDLTKGQTIEIVLKNKKLTFSK
ncbi:MAG: ATP-dependent Clp protease ATP-binding subunit [Patescibacteria group bacterium]|jgi:ATP-dependent Clp protease ATP-binding subunit ClpC